jgi:TRAP-type C4-dicarboxylate transport system substrate-binding protein
LLISEMTWQKLTPEQQKIVSDAATQARDYERQLSLKADQELEAACKKEGMTVTHPDKAPFAEAVASVYTNASVIKAIGGGNAAEGQKLIDAAIAAAR